MSRHRRRSTGTGAGARRDRSSPTARANRLARTLLYLPPYSPDYNPIEMAFAKLKALLRKAAARTVDDLWDAIADAIDAFTSTECENYFAAAGYDRD